MHAPSFWLALLTALIPFAIGFIGSVGAVMMDQAKGRQDPLLTPYRVASADLTAILLLVVPPLLFYALVGEFPVVFVGVAIALYFIAGLFDWFIARAAGLSGESRLRETTVLALIFARRHTIWGGLVLLVVTTLMPFVISMVAYFAARGVDVGTEDGKFSVALVVFTGQALVSFVLSILLLVSNLLSPNTSRQARVSIFAQSMRNFVAGAWLAVFPFYQWRVDMITDHHDWVTAAVFAIVAVYFATVVLPFQIGRTVFDLRKRAALARLTDACDRVIVSTDEHVSEGFKKYTMESVDRDLRELFLEQVRGCDFFRYYAARPYLQAQAATGSTELATLPVGRTGEFDMQPTGDGAGQAAYRAFLLEEVIRKGGQMQMVPQWEWIAEDHVRTLPKLDHRIFLLNRIEDFLENRADEGWLRGLALQTKADAEKWLVKREGRSVLLASAGVVLSLVVPLAKDEFGGEARAALRQFTKDAGALVAPPQTAPPAKR